MSKMPSGPKNNKYTNRHSEEARLRDEERRINERSAANAAKEDLKWSETDPKALKKLAKERELEEKAAAKTTRDMEKKEQMKEEEREINAKVPVKVSKRQLQKDLSKMLSDYDRQRDAVRFGTGGTGVEAAKDDPLPSGNVNKARGMQPFSDNGVVQENTINASGSVGAVLNALEKSGATSAEIPDNRHIGKRAKVLYKAFVTEHWDQVREEKPGLRRTQYNDVIWEMWQKSPNNPFVLRNEKIAQERLDAERRWMEGDADSENDEEGEGDDHREA